MATLDEEILRIRAETGVTPEYVRLIGGKYPLWKGHRGEVSFREQGYLSLTPKEGSDADVVTRYVAGTAQAPSREFSEIPERNRLHRLLAIVRQSFEFYKFRGKGPTNLLPEIQEKIGVEESLDYGLRTWVGRQGNRLGIPFNASQKEYSDQLRIYSQGSHSEHDNRLYIATGILNNGMDIAAALTPMIMDPTLQAAFPEDTQILARAYHNVIEERLMECDNIPFSKICSVARPSFPYNNEDERALEAEWETIRTFEKMYGLEPLPR